MGSEMCIRDRGTPACPCLAPSKLAMACPPSFKGHQSHPCRPTPSWAQSASWPTAETCLLGSALPWPQALPDPALGVGSLGDGAARSRAWEAVPVLPLNKALPRASVSSFPRHGASPLPTLHCAHTVPTPFRVQAVGASREDDTVLTPENHGLAGTTSSTRCLS